MTPKMKRSEFSDSENEIFVQGTLHRLRKRFTEEQIIGILKEAEAGVKVAKLCRKHGISDATYYNWKAKFGEMPVPNAQPLTALGGENARLKRLLAESMLDNAALKDVLGRKW